MDYGDWFFNPQLHLDIIKHGEEVKAAKKEKEERERRKEKTEVTRTKKKNEQQQAKAEEEKNKPESKNEVGTDKNAFETFVKFVKQEFLEDKPATKSYISIDDFAKSKNRSAAGDIKVRLTTVNPPVNVFHELVIVPTQRSVYTKEASTDLPGISNTFGTRNFIPAFMGCVAFLSLTMILFAVGRWFLYRTFQKRRTTNNSKNKTLNPEDGNLFSEEGCKLQISSFEPSAPAEPEFEQGNDAAKMYTRQKVSRIDNDARAITDFRLKYQTAVGAKRGQNSKSLMPLLEHVFGRPNECENCRLPFNSQRCYPNLQNRM